MFVLMYVLCYICVGMDFVDLSWERIYINIYWEREKWRVLKYAFAYDGVRFSRGLCDDSWVELLTGCLKAWCCKFENDQVKKVFVFKHTQNDVPETAESLHKKRKKDHVFCRKTKRGTLTGNQDAAHFSVRWITVWRSGWNGGWVAVLVHKAGRSICVTNPFLIKWAANLILQCLQNQAVGQCKKKKKGNREGMVFDAEASCCQWLEYHD